MQITNMIKPSISARRKVSRFLTSHGIPASHHKYLGNDDFLRINATVSHLEQALGVKLMVFKHNDVPVQYIRCATHALALYAVHHACRCNQECSAV
jgi:hypothetical protein